MKIAIASGKGGAGKTTVATSMASISHQRGFSTAFLDCDVEEPNGHLYLHPVFDHREPVLVPVPVVDEAACRAAGTCGQCGKVCQFSAIICILDSVRVNAELCHGCGACLLACPAQAIKEKPHPVGMVESGLAGGIQFVHGLLDIGQAMATPVIRAVKRSMPSADVVVLDAPPGTTCPTVETLRDADKVLLVAEATPFGFHDFTLAAQMVQSLKRPLWAMLNRVDGPVDDILAWCGQQRIPVLTQVADRRDVAEACSRGQMPLDCVPQFRTQMMELFAKLVSGEAK